MREATCAASKTSKVPTQDALLFISYSMVKLKQWGMECCVHVSSRSWGGTTQRAAAWETIIIRAIRSLLNICSIDRSIETI
jgi:hypothetical protein